MKPLVNMSPPFALFDVSDHRTADAVIRADFPLGSFIAANGFDLLDRKFRGGILFSLVLSLSASPSVHHVLDILSLRTWSKVPRVHAIATVARMSQYGACRSSLHLNPAVCLLPCFHMSGDKAVCSPKPAISGTKRTEPRPAVIWSTNIHVGPELCATTLKAFRQTDKFTVVTAVFCGFRPVVRCYEGLLAGLADSLDYRKLAVRVLAQSATIVELPKSLWRFLERSSAIVANDRNGFVATRSSFVGNLIASFAKFIYRRASQVATPSSSSLVRAVAGSILRRLSHVLSAFFIKKELDRFDLAVFLHNLELPAFPNLHKDVPVHFQRGAKSFGVFPITGHLHDVFEMGHGSV